MGHKPGTAKARKAAARLADSQRTLARGPTADIGTAERPRHVPANRHERRKVRSVNARRA
jgi:hypothetical protein